jgi:hypothetical protein
MLFDLRAPGRKRVIQVVYVVLAVVLVGGTILFGVGTGLPGIFGGADGTSGGQSLEDQRADQIKAAEKRIAANPNDAAAYAAVARLRYAAGLDDFPENATTAPPAAKAEFEKAATAWEKYLSLNPKTIDQGTANRMSAAFSPSGLNQPAKWADVQGIVTTAAEDEAEKRGEAVEPGTYVTLLTAQYAAKRTRQAKITERKLREVTPKELKKQVDAAIALAKNPDDPKAQAAAQAAQGTGTTGGTVTLPEDEK